MGREDSQKIHVCLIDKQEFQIKWAKERVLVYGANEFSDLKAEIKEEMEARDHQHEDSEEEGGEEERGVEQGDDEDDDEDGFQLVEGDDA